MIDLTPLDVRKKRGDFKKILRGYDPDEVDVFLELVAERLEELVLQNVQLKERSESLQTQVSSQSGREQAVQDALVTAQELRSEIRTTAQKEADLILKEAETEARRLKAEAEAEVRTRIRDAERRLLQGQDALEEMERRRNRFLKSYRQLLEREMDVVEVEDSRPPLEDRPIDLDLGGGRPEEEEEEAEELEGMAAADAGDEAPDEGSDEDTPPVDEDAAARPPLDASVDELAAAYEETTDAPSAEESESLLLSLEEVPDEDTPRE